MDNLFSRVNLDALIAAAGPPQLIIKLTRVLDGRSPKTSGSSDPDMTGDELNDLFDTEMGLTPAAFFHRPLLAKLSGGAHAEGEALVRSWLEARRAEVLAALPGRRWCLHVDLDPVTHDLRLAEAHDDTPEGAMAAWN